MLAAITPILALPRLVEAVEPGPWTVTAPQSSIALAVDQLGRVWSSTDQDGPRVADGVRRVDFPEPGGGALAVTGYI